MKEEGFDLLPINSTSGVNQFVYWEPGSCLALASLSLKSCKQCEICLDYLGDDMGFACAKDHFNCWECLEKHVMHTIQPDSVGRSIKEETGNLLCPHFECSDEITMLNLAKVKVPEKIFDLIEKQKTEFTTKKIVEKELKEQESTLRKEYEDLMNIKDEKEREVCGWILSIRF